ncbi:hypothetical protein [Aliarcobacter butzleri]|uniref:capsular polysaccharide export protein, LipB/KpsS family n=1 Tax=Aliarcobacter butzleri TaxID=28197 RepID=UPI003AF9AE6B
MNLFRYEKDIINLIKTTKKKVVICALTNSNQQFIIKNGLENYVSYIFDNDKKKFGSKFLNSLIIDFDYLKTLEDVVVIILDHHVNSFYHQIKDLTNCEIIIKQKDYLTHAQNLTSLFNKSFFFELESPNFQIKESLDASHKFIPIITQVLLNYKQQIKIIPIEYGIKSYFINRRVKKNSILISYHSIGKNKKNLLRWKEGYLTDSITFYQEGFSGWNKNISKRFFDEKDNIPLELAQNKLNSLIKNFINTNQSKYIQPKKKDTSFPNNFIFFPLQKIDDCVMLKSNFPPLELIENIITLVIKKDIILYLKRHPRCYDEKLTKLLDKYKNSKNIILYSGSIHDAISHATTIYTINSGVGFESLLHLKPVVTFGKSDYMCVTRHIRNLKELEKEPFYYLTKEEKNTIIKFIYFYIENETIFLTDNDKLQSFIEKQILNYLEG